MKAYRRKFLALGFALTASAAPGLAGTADQGGRRALRPGERLLFHLRSQGLARRRGQ